MKEIFTRLTIRRKIFLSFTVVFMLVVITILLIFPGRMANQEREAIKNKAISIAKLTAYVSEADLDFGLVDGVERTIQIATRDKDKSGISFIYFYDRDGNEFASYNAQIAQSMTISLADLFNKTEVSDFVDRNQYQVIFIPIILNEEKIGALLMGFSLKDVNRQIRINSLLTFAVSVFIMLIGIFTTYYISGFFVKRLQNVIEIVKDVAEGDLRIHLTDYGTDELGDFANNFNLMIDNMQAIISKVQQAIFKLDASIKDIQKGVQHQAATSTEQSASISETTATMEELAQTSRQIAQNSDSVVEVAKKTENSAQSGVQAATDTFSKMEEVAAKNQENIKDIVDLGKKSERIHEIMEIINAITDQTKLIAFNAAIEAAGAGESGRRFGIVATEIRSLADDVEKSTSEIKNKINEIQRAINRLVIASEEETRRLSDGVKFTQMTVAALEEILEGATRTTVAAKEISLATQQQRTASEQIVTALKETSQATKNYVVTANETSVITTDLATLSVELKQLINRFRV